MERLTAPSSGPLVDLRHAIEASVFGQPEAVDAVLRVVGRASLGLNGGHPNRPRACLAFLGPTGVGKTELAKRLARHLHGDLSGFLRIDCSLYQHGHEIGHLLGAPPSYVGREQRPIFDSEVFDRDQNVILFDEIEKGHSDLWNILLQIMEEGEIKLLRGDKTVNFRRSIVILTSNVGAKEMGDLAKGRYVGFKPTTETPKTAEDIHRVGVSALQRVFSPEWINRLDEIITFKPLAEEHLAAILDRMLRESNAQYAQIGLEINLTDAAKQHVLKLGYKPEYGARPLRTALLKHVEAPLSDLLGGRKPNGLKVLVDVEDGQIVFFAERVPYTAPPEPPPAPPEPGPVDVSFTDAPFNEVDCEPAVRFWVADDGTMMANVNGYETRNVIIKKADVPALSRRMVAIYEYVVNNPD